MNKDECPLIEKKETTSNRLVDEALGLIKKQRVKRINAIWLEATGCSGNIILGI